MPVLLMSDQSLSHRTESVPRPDLDSVEVWERITPDNIANYPQYNGAHHTNGTNGHGVTVHGEGMTDASNGSEWRVGRTEEEGGDPVYVRNAVAINSYGIDLTHIGVDRVPPDDKYVRFAITESGISPMSVPGMRGNCRYVSTGIEHDLLADPNYTPEYHTLMTHKRFRKLETALNDVGESVIRRFGAENPDVLVIAWGSTSGPAREAVERACSERRERWLARADLAVAPAQEHRCRNARREARDRAGGEPHRAVRSPLAC